MCPQNWLSVPNHGIRMHLKVSGLEGLQGMCYGSGLSLCKLAYLLFNDINVFPRLSRFKSDFTLSVVD
jgi:hypothetical protein